MNGKKPTPEQLIGLRHKYNLTQEAFAKPLYGIKARRIRDWETGRRDCPPVVWWVMNLIWDGVDLREVEGWQDI